MDVIETLLGLKRATAIRTRKLRDDKQARTHRSHASNSLKRRIPINSDIFTASEVLHFSTASASHVRRELVLFSATRAPHNRPNNLQSLTLVCYLSQL